MKLATSTTRALRSTPLPTAKPLTQANRPIAPAHGYKLRADVAEWQAMRLMKMACASTAEPAAASTAVADAPSAPSADVDVSACDIRVGLITKCEKHPEADSLYVEEIECGDAEGPRTIVSGLVSFVPLEQMQNRKVIVIANLKPRNMRGVKSNGMVLCASNDAHDKVEPLEPPADAKPGERVWFGEGNEKQPAPAEPNRVQKKKIWESVQPHLKTSGTCVAGFKGRTMLTSAGPVTAKSLANANIA